MTRILIVDDHPIFREGLATRTRSQLGMRVCGEAESVDQALQHLQAVQTDLAIIDIALKSSHGLDLVRKIKKNFPIIKMLVVSAYEDSLYAERAFRAGAHGYINKGECQANLIRALSTVCAGKLYASEEVKQALLNQSIGAAAGMLSASPVEALTDRELAVFQLIGQGMRTGEIAKHLNISPHTVESHREKVKAKLKLANGAKLQQAAVQWSILGAPR